MPHRGTAAWGRALGHLVRTGLLDGRDALAGRIVVQPAQGSNEVGIVRVGGRPVLVLKRNSVAVDGVDPFVAERDAYRWLAARTHGAALAPGLVAVLDDTLVLEALEGLRPFHERRDSDGDPAPILEMIGRRLAELHSAPPDRERLRLRRPWVLDVPGGDLPDLFSGDPELRSLAARIGASASLCAAVEELDRSWRPLAPIHGDVKFDNILVGADPPEDDSRTSKRAPCVVLIDWELAGLGLPAWDVAGLLDGLVVPALQSGPVDDVLAELRPALRAVASHRSAVGSRLAPDDRSLMVATVVRLIQSSIQLHAMRHLRGGRECARGSRRVLEGARALADRIAGGSLEAAWVA